MTTGKPAKCEKFRRPSWSSSRVPTAILQCRMVKVFSSLKISFKIVYLCILLIYPTFQIPILLVRDARYVMHTSAQLLARSAGFNHDKLWVPVVLCHSLRR